MLSQFHKALAGLSLAQAALFTALAPVPAAAQSVPNEVQVGTRDIIDFEFDWGRDGVLCPTCNFGAGNSRLAYVDETGSLWVGYIDYNTGHFLPSNGKGVLVDKRAVSADAIGNGPEWMASQRGSELVYSRWANGGPKNDVRNISIGHAFIDPSAGQWTAQSIDGTKGYVLPVGSLDVEDPVPLIHYQNFSKRKTDLYWRTATADSAPNYIQLSSNDPGVTRRWVPGTNKIILTYEAPPVAGQAEGVVYRQVWLYSPNDGSLEQLTFEPQSKYWAFMWQAPEYNNEFVFFVMVGSKELHIYRRTPQSDGTIAWTVSNKILMPADLPFISSPEPFVHNGKSWVFFTVSSKRDNANTRVASHVAMTGIVPGDTVQVLTADPDRQHVRRDPEYFITAKGPFLYYNRYAIAPTGESVHEGIFHIDTGLGPTDPQLAGALNKASKVKAP